MKEKCSAILLVGNGINRAFEKSDDSIVPESENWDFEGMSWKSIIRQLLFNYGNNDIKYEDISNLPMPLQIITATKDNVDTAMKALSQSMCSEIISDEKMMFCKKLLSLSVDDIITTAREFQDLQSKYKSKGFSVTAVNEYIHGMAVDNVQIIHA